MTLVVYTTELPQPVQSELVQRFRACRIEMADVDRARFPRSVRVIVTAPACPLHTPMIESLPRSIGLIAAYSAGTDYIDTAAAKRRAITVTNTPDALTEATADVAMLLILSACRNASWAERQLRSGRWKGASLLDMFGVDVAGRTLGVLGFGRIGRATARRALASGMRVIYHSPRAAPGPPAIPFEADFAQFLRASDVLSLHAPLTPMTYRIIDRKAIASMRRGSILINTARGDLVDDEAVIDALHSGHLRAAGLDVFAGEPFFHPGYLTLDNVTLLPHLGSATVETRIAMGRQLIANIEAFLAGDGVPNPVVLCAEQEPPSPPHPPSSPPERDC